MTDIKELKQWVVEHQLEEKTVENFWKVFFLWKEEDKEEFNNTFRLEFKREELYVYTDKVALTITNWPDEDYNHVVVYLKFEYNDVYIGNYRMVFDLQGEIEDDYFVIDSWVD
ncbi:hypothetical protein [Priestia koreensis]|uniref:hypothetical protein n=1 Tax=Priestia koreensis TaxID=284581 RepID=UPI001F58F9E2|nr:hypothetical protein [Priestia koreensis]UNL87482.1 hypothetical protein IE339_24505 [Priestia koreensis]